jgi:hypothetical protein
MAELLKRVCADISASLGYELSRKNGIGRPGSGAATKVKKAA